MTKDTRWDPVSGARFNDPATAYIAQDGAYVIRNDRTGVIVEVSDRSSINGVAFWTNGKDGIATFETAEVKIGAKVEEKFAGKAESLVVKEGVKGSTAGGLNEAVKPGEKVYRVWGDGASANGRSWSRTDPGTEGNYRDVAGLPDQNSGRFISEGTLTNAEGVTQREALQLHGNKGGIDELVVPDPTKQIRLDGVAGVNPEF